MIVSPATTSLSLDVQVVDDNGLPVTGLVAATFPALSYARAGANGTQSITLSDLSTLTSAWSSGGVKERSGGFYRLDLPNAALTAAGEVTIFGETTGKHVLAPRVMVGANVSADVVSVLTDSTAASGLSSMGDDYFGNGYITVNIPAIAAAVWDTLTSAARTAGSYGAKLKAWVLGSDNKALLSTDAGAIPANAITAASIAAAALNGKGDWLLATSYTAPDNADIATALADLVTLLARTDPTTAIAAIKVVTDALATTYEVDTANAGKKRFTAAALVNAPTGGGGGGTVENIEVDVEQTTIEGS